MRNARERIKNAGESQADKRGDCRLSMGCCKLRMEGDGLSYNCSWQIEGLDAIIHSPWSSEGG